MLARPLVCRSSLVALIAACSSAGAPRDAAAPPDAAAPDSAVDGSPETPPDLRPTQSGLPLPAGVAPPRRFIDEPARLTGSGATGCSSQQPATGEGHRWCAFSRPVGMQTELWTIDVTAAARQPPRCDGSDPGCRRLTGTLWTEFPLNGPVHPYSHQFDGDTLVYYADAVSAAHLLHRGPVYAWRPDWPQPRPISSPAAVACWAHARLPVAHCLEDVVGQVNMPDLVELRAGPLAEGVALSSLGWIRTFANGAPSWQAGFSPAGDLFAVSSPDPDPAVEALRIVATGDLGRAPPAEVVRDASSWEISPRGRHVLFYRQATRDQKVLHVADLPTGANVTRIEANVKDFLFVGPPGDDSLIYLTESDADHGALRLLRDLARPASAATVFSYTDAIEDVRVSPDLRFTAWTDAHFTVRVVNHAGMTSCDLNADPRRNAFEPVFLDGAGLVFWNEESAADIDRRDGYLADPSGCRDRQRFAQDVELILPVGDRGVVFTDEVDPGHVRVTLKYAALAGGKWPADGPIRIHDDVDGSSVFLVPSPAGTLVLFRVIAGDPAALGTYVFLLPF